MAGIIKILSALDLTEKSFPFIYAGDQIGHLSAILAKKWGLNQVLLFRQDMILNLLCLDRVLSYINCAEFWYLGNFDGKNRKSIS